jgi:hypothetical protein
VTRLIRILTIATVALTAGSNRWALAEMCCAADGDFVRPGSQQSPPIRLRVAATTTFEITLAWDQVPGATAYILQRSTEPAFDPQTTKTFPLHERESKLRPGGQQTLNGREPPDIAACPRLPVYASDSIRASVVHTDADSFKLLCA